MGILDRALKKQEEKATKEERERAQEAFKRRDRAARFATRFLGEPISPAFIIAEHLHSAWTMQLEGMSFRIVLDKGKDEDSDRWSMFLRVYKIPYVVPFGQELERPKAVPEWQYLRDIADIASNKDRLVEETS